MSDRVSLRVTPDAFVRELWAEVEPRADDHVRWGAESVNRRRCVSRRALLRS